MATANEPPNRVAAAIDAVIAAESARHEDELRNFLERIREKYDESIRATTKYFVLVQLAWILTFALATRRIDEASSLFGIPINQKMLMISPFLVGVLTYLLLSSMAAAVILWEVVSTTVRHTLPSAWERGLDCFLAPPTFSCIERLLEPMSPSKLSTSWFILITFLIFLGTILVLGHTTFLVWGVPDISRVITSLSALLGLIAWLRGLSLATTAIRATGGFAMRHHRGAAANRSGHWLN